MKLKDESVIRLIDEEITQLEERVEELSEDINKAYRSVQDFRVSANKTDTVIAAIKKMQSEQRKIKGQIKRKKNERTRKVKEASRRA